MDSGLSDNLGESLFYLILKMREKGTVSIAYIEDIRGSFHLNFNPENNTNDCTITLAEKSQTHTSVIIIT